MKNYTLHCIGFSSVITKQHYTQIKIVFSVSTTSSLASASSSKITDGHVSITPASTTFHSLDTDYTPIIISIAAGFACFIVYVCFMCIVHSWWLKRNKFTEVNSTPLKDIEKRKRKEELRELRRQRIGNSQVSNYSLS